MLLCISSLVLLLSHSTPFYVLVFYSLADGHLGGSHFGAIMSKAAINTHIELKWTVDVFEKDFPFS